MRWTNRRGTASHRARQAQPTLASVRKRRAVFSLRDEPIEVTSAQLLPILLLLLPPAKLDTKVMARWLAPVLQQPRTARAARPRHRISTKHH